MVWTAPSHDRFLWWIVCLGTSLCVALGAVASAASSRPVPGSPSPVSTTKAPAPDEPFWQKSTFNAANLGGQALWVGRDAVQEPWVNAPGYGNNWVTPLDWFGEVASTGSQTTVRWRFQFNHDTEINYDFFIARWDSGGTWVELARYDGSNKDGGGQFITPVIFDEIWSAPPSSYVGPNGDQVHLQLLVTTDGSYSDEDGIIDTSGAVQVDNINVDFFGNPVSIANFEPLNNFGQDGDWTPDGFEWLDIAEGAAVGGAGSAGVTWANFVGSLLPDLFISNFNGPNTLLGNITGGILIDQSFSPLNDAGAGSGAAAADYDNDGDIDLAIANQVTASLLLRNDGIGSMTNVTPVDMAALGNARGLDWGDYDGDGDLDLYMGFLSGANRLLRNDGGSSFVDVATGDLADLADTQSANWGDYDGDGDLDLALGSGPASKVLRNDGSTGFVNVTPAAMGDGFDTAWGDYDNDGDLDLFVGSYVSTNVLLRNDGNDNFADATTPALANAAGATTGAIWADYDNDTDLDLLLNCDGCANQYLINDGAGGFSVGNTSAFANTGQAFGIGATDIDADGDLDCYTSNFDGANVLLSNRVGSRQNYLRVNVEGTASNRDGVGARIRVVAGGLTQIREVEAPSGYPSGSEKTAHFGLGGATIADTVEVTWPSGVVQTLTNQSVDRVLNIQEPAPTAGFFRAKSVDTGGVAKRVGVDCVLLRPQDSLTNVAGTIDLSDNNVGSIASGARDNELFIWLPLVNSLATVDPVAGAQTAAVAVAYPAGVVPTATANAIAYDAVQKRLYIQTRDASDHLMFTLDPTTGEALLLGAITFSGGPAPTSVFKAMAVNSKGNIYAVSRDAGDPSFWSIDPNTLSATLAGTPTAYTFNNTDGIAFLGDELWVLQNGSNLFRVEPDAPNAGDVLGTFNTSGAILTGLSDRRCVPGNSPLTVVDTPEDGGGSIDISWAAYTPPPGTTSYEILRSLESCELYDPGLAAITSIAAGTQTYTDDTPSDYTAYYYGVRVLDSGGNTLDTLAGGPAAAKPNIVLNEFAPAGGVFPKRKGKTPQSAELVEIKNLSSDVLDLTGFRLSNGPGFPTPNEEVLSGNVPANGFFVVVLSQISLPDEGGTLQLLPPAGNGIAFDIVSYGTQGGAPTVPEGFTVNRVPGTEADDLDSNSFEAGEPSTNAENNVAAPELGGSLVLNEVLYTEGVLPNRDYIEIFNRQANVAVLNDIVISDGISFFDTLTTNINLAPGQIVLLEQGLPGSFQTNLQSQLLYLYKITAGGLLKRIDQLGWTGGPTPGPAPGDALLRVPDGAAVYLGNQGANWADAGGDDVLVYGERTPGAANSDPRFTEVVVDPGGGQDYLSINAALADVDLQVLPPGTRILLADGTYNESFALRSDIEILGLTGDPGAVVIRGDGTGPTVTAVGIDGATLIGVTLRDGLALQGGALFAQNASFSARQVRFEDNQAQLGAPAGPGPGTFGNIALGGAVYLEGCTADFEGCLFLRNESEEIAGGMAAEGNQISLNNCLFVLNGAGTGGAAICADDGGGVPATIDVNHCVFDRNFTYSGVSGTIEVFGGATMNVNYSTVTNDFGGAPISVLGGGVVNFSCGGLFGGARPIDTAVALSDVVVGDPAFCQPLAFNYSYDDLSPLATPPAACFETIGITGPPCVEIPTSIPQTPVPHVDRLYGATPNPFNPATLLRFDLARPAKVSLALFDARGRRVASVVREQSLEAGVHERVWNGVDDRGQRVASGVYFARFTVNGSAVGPAQRLVLLK